MGKYLITGIAGSGKTTVIDGLSRRGFSSYSTDDVSSLTRLELRATGQPVPWPDGPTDFSKYAWNLQERPLKALLASAPDVFIGTVASNQQQFFPLFDQIFLLAIDETTLRSRLRTRTNNDFGKHPDDLAQILRGRSKKQAALLAQGAVPIDSRQPLHKVVDDILAAVAYAR